MSARPLGLPLLLTTIAALCAPTLAAAQQPSEAQRLIDAYAPIVMLREQTDPPCDTTEEQYQPTAVSTMLDNPTVTLTKGVPGKGQVAVQKAPTAADVAGLGEDYHLDLRGDPLGDTCVYARDFAKLKREGRAPAVTYAHIDREAGHPGFVVQYWFFYYFNQFNDVHEGDWEGMQIAFEAETPKRALAEGPSEMILFQHAGGERADWDVPKVEKEGTHPIVYPAAGSHATFYDSAVYVENGQEGSGVGCDNTSEPLRRLALRPIPIPTQASRNGRFKWLTYSGHWGQEEEGFNNGPTGVTTKTVWREPFAWMSEQRTTSPRLPGGSIAGPAVTNAFCGTVAAVSEFINLKAKSTAAAIVALAVALALVGLFVGLTKWGPVDLTELRARRSFGQLVRAARQLYGRHWLPLVAIGLTALPIIGVVSGLSALASGGRELDRTTHNAGFHVAAGEVIGGIGKPIASAIVAAVVIVFVRLLIDGERSGFLSSYRGMLRRFWRVVFAQLLATLGVFLLALTVIGLPIAAWKYVSWSFVQQEILFGDKPIREAFRGSSARVRGRWWHTVRVVGFLWLLSLIVGPILGFALIFTHLPLIWVDVFGSVVFALMVPYVALGRTLLYFDLGARAAEAPARPWRRRLRRAAPASAETSG